MRKVAALCAVLLVVATLFHAQEPPLRGQVVNRDGIPQKGCRLEFLVNYDDSKAAFEVYTDEYGVFLLYGPPNGSFFVRISLDNRSTQIKGRVRIDSDKKNIHPNPLIVDW